MADVFLRIGNNDIEGWENLHIRKSMNEIACSFGFSTSDFSVGNFSKWGFKIEDVGEVYINDTLICTGYIDEIPVEYTSDNHFIQFIGRGKPSDLIDCNFVESTNEWKNETALNIIKALCSPYDISVEVDTTVTNVVSELIPEFKASEGEFVYNLINELCKDLNILPFDNPDGKLKLMRATTNDYTNDPIQFDGNTSKAKIIQSNVNRYSQYIVKGFGIGTDNKTLEDYIIPSATVNDTIVTRYRPLVIFADRPTDKGKCENRANYEARVRAGNSRGIIYEIPSFVQTNDEVWQINKLTKVKDDNLGIEDTLLISEIDYIESPTEGQKVMINVVDKDTYSGTTDEINIKTGFDED
jgi:prophage tail gpP-like protein